MFWNRDNLTTKRLFDKTNTADTQLGLFYDNQACDTCEQDCCIVEEGSNEPVLMEALSCCVEQEGCDSVECVEFFQAIVNNCINP